MKTMFIATSALAALAMAGPVWAQTQPAPVPGGTVEPDMLCSEVIAGGPDVARDAASFFSGFLGGVQTASTAAGGQASTQQAGTQQTTPDTGGDPTQQADQSAGPTPTEPQGSGGNNAGGASAETAADAAPADDGTILTGAGNFAPNDNAAQAGSNTLGGAGTAPEAGVAAASLTAEQLLAACQASPSARVASVLPNEAGVPAGATSTNSLQSSGGAPGASDTGTTSGTAGAPAAPAEPAAPPADAAPIEVD